MNEGTTVEQLRRQQAAFAKLCALGREDRHRTLTAAVTICAQGLDSPICKLWKHRVDGKDLMVEAGFGLQSGIVGIVISPADVTSPQGRSFVSRKPFMCSDVRKDALPAVPAYYDSHGIISIVDVVVSGDSEPYGVLEVAIDREHTYSEGDIAFLEGFANGVAAAIACDNRIASLEARLDKATGQLSKAEALEAENKLLSRELSHRVRNNLQLVYGILMRQFRATSYKPEKRRILATAARLSTLAQVYEFLPESPLMNILDLGAYLKAQCADLARRYENASAGVKVLCEIEPLQTDLDTGTALAIIVSELVENSFAHAFPRGKGKIEVKLHRDAGAGVAMLSVGDDGRGYRPNAAPQVGLNLVRKLADQIHATAEVDGGRGTLWTITFPIDARINAGSPAGS